MALDFHNLDEQTRQLMLEEVDRDINDNTLYISPRLTVEGRRQYPELLRQAAAEHDDMWLAAAMRARHLFATEESRRKPSGGNTVAKVPVTAPDTLAEGEFNRFYCRAVCRRAIESGQQQVRVYRAKQVERPRPESEVKRDSLVNAQALLNDLRTHQGIDPALGLPPGPNSGLSIELL